MGTTPTINTFTKNVICAFCLKGRCTRNPCRFLHLDTSIQPPTQHFDGHVKTQPQIRVCDRWVSGSCTYGDKCRFLHTWFHSDEDKHSLSLLTRLEGHKKAVSGVGLPSGSDKLYSGAKHGTVRVWDCNTGNCVKVINNGAEIGCLITEGSWVFIGLPNTVLRPGDWMWPPVITKNLFLMDLLVRLMSLLFVMAFYLPDHKMA